jgi:hypothetical protein
MRAIAMDNGEIARGAGSYSLLTEGTGRPK